jgi:hypothetical protein
MRSVLGAEAAPGRTDAARMSGLSACSGPTAFVRSGLEIFGPSVSAARVGRIDRSVEQSPCARRSDRPKPASRQVILDGDRQSDGRCLEISASACADGTTDWRWPPTYGSGPYAVTPHCVLPIDSARERRAPSCMKECGRAAGAGIAQGIGAL